MPEEQESFTSQGETNLTTVDQNTFKFEECFKSLHNKSGDVFLQKYGNFNKLDSGNFGKVYSCSKFNTKKLFAVKSVEIDESMDPVLISREIEVLEKLEHENIIKFKDVYFNNEEDMFAIVMEFCLGSLYQIICLPMTKISEDDSFHLMNPILQGLKYIHAQGMIHRDINTSNLMITMAYQIVISDFGCVSTNPTSNSLVGSPFWMAPELIKGEEYNSKVDIWSIGISIIELLDITNPHFKKQVMNVLYETETGPPPGFQSESYPNANQVLSHTLDKNPTTRYPASALLNLDQIKKSTNHVYILALITGNANNNSCTSLPFSVQKRLREDLSMTDSLKHLDSHSLMKLSQSFRNSSSTFNVKKEQSSSNKAMNKLNKLRNKRNIEVNKIESMIALGCIQVKKISEKLSAYMTSQFNHEMHDYSKKCSNDAKYIYAKCNKFMKNISTRIDKFSKKLDKVNKKHKVDCIYRLYYEFGIPVENILRIIDCCNTLLCKEFIFEAQAVYFNEMVRNLGEISSKVLKDFFEKLAQQHSSNMVKVQKCNSREQDYASRKIFVHVSSLYADFLKFMKVHSKNSQSMPCIDLYKQFKNSCLSILSECKKKPAAEAIEIFESFINQRLEILSNHICPNEKLHQIDELHNKQTEALVEYRKVKEFIISSTENSCKTRTDTQIGFNIDMKDSANNNLTYTSDKNFILLKDEMQDFKLEIEETKVKSFEKCKQLGLKSFKSFEEVLQLIKTEFTKIGSPIF